MAAKNVPGEVLMVDRVHEDVLCPPTHALTKARLFHTANGLPDMAILKDHLLKEGRLEPECAEALIAGAQAHFKTEPNTLELPYPITVCGDIHGQFFDLVRLFEVGGDPKDTQFLFLGDFVDRGCFATEVVFYLYAFKMCYPKSFWMLRGNHECRQLTAFFNFKDECVYKYDEAMYDLIMNSFDHLPISAIVNKSFFCVHGGLSPDITNLEEIAALDRFQEIPREGPLCDLLWADPYEADKDDDESDDPPQPMTSWFGYNETRQCSYIFGIEAVKQFLKDNKLTSIIRAHEAQVDGYKMHMVNKTSGIPRVITIFSAPNYCDVYKNKAACLKFDTNVLNIKQFVDSSHPYYLPNFMDVFQWSLPFVAEKVTDMLAAVLEYNVEDDEEAAAAEKSEEIVHAKKGQLKKKVLAVTKLLRMYKVLRIESENIVKLKGMTPNHKVPFGLLGAGQDAIDAAVKNFSGAKNADMINEVRPGSKPAAAGGKEEVMPKASGSI